MRANNLNILQWRDLGDEDREEMLAEDELVCPGCGYLRSECSDKSRDWFPEWEFCGPTAVLEFVKRRLGERYKDNQPNGQDLHPLDGVSLWVSSTNVRPDDTFLD